MLEIHKKFAFTLVELIITVTIISLLATIIIVIINPSLIFINARNGQRKDDLATMRGAFVKYFSDAEDNGTPGAAPLSFSSFTGYSSMVSNAIANTPSSICPTGQNLNNVVNPFSLQSGSGANTLSIDKLLNNGYLTQVLKDPLSGNPYKACIDPCNNQQMVLYADTQENVSNNINIPLGQIGITNIGIINYPCFVQSASNLLVKSTSYPYCAGNTVTVTLPNPPSPGNFLVVTTWNHNMSNYTTSAIASVNDNVGNGNYTLAIQNSNSSSMPAITMWYKKIIYSGQTFTISGIPKYTDNQNCSLIAVHEYKGLISGTLDQTSSTAKGLGYTFCTGIQTSGSTYTTTQNTELLVGAFYFGAPNGITTTGITFTQGTNYTSRELQEYDTDALFTEDNVVITTGSYSATVTIGYPDCANQFLIATFK